MHVLIPGGAGSIGRHLADSRLTNGQQVAVLEDFDPFDNRTIKEGNIEAQRDHPARRPVEGLEGVLNKTAEVRWLPPEPGEVPQTWVTPYLQGSSPSGCRRRNTRS